MLPKNSKNHISGLQGSYSNVIINKGGNTYIRPFVRNDISMYHILQGDFLFNIYTFTI